MARAKQAQLAQRKSGNAARRDADDAAVVQEDGSDGSLPSAPAHTAQLVLILLLQAVLLVFTVFYLPQGVLTKKGPPFTLTAGIYDMLNPSDRDAAKVRASVTKPLLSLFVVQGWCISRLGWWWRVGEKLEKYESIKLLKKQSSLMKQAETVVMTTFALPLPIALSWILIVLFGAPFFAVTKWTLLLATYVTLLAFFQPMHTLGEDWQTWVRLFAAFDLRNGREKVLVIQTLAPLVGAWLGAAGLALDWARPWQAWPVPNIVGCVLGAALGNLICIPVYVLDRPRAVSSSKQS